MVAHRSLLTVLLVAAMFQVSAQDTASQVRPPDFWDTLPQHTLKLNPIAWFHPALFYEYHLHRRHALEASIGGAPQMEFAAGMHYVGLAMGTLSYRFYFAKLLDMLFFVQAGGCMVYASGKFDIFDGSEGWEIHTRKYHYHRLMAAPDIGWGFRIGTGKRFTVEAYGLIALGNHWHQYNSGPIMDDAKLLLQGTQMFGIKFGWSF